MHILNNGIKRIANSLGIEITRLKNVPSYTFMGLRDLSIKTIIDVGANKGQFAKKALTVFPKAKIYSFEPLPTVFEELNSWATSLGSSKIEIFNLALGNEEGQVDMFLHTEHNSSSSILETTSIEEKLYPFTKKQEKIPIKLTKMDIFFKENKKQLDSGLLIKLDVQGYEDRVIRGGTEVFSKAVACIIEVCVTDLYKNQANFQTIVDLLYSLDYVYSGNFDQVYSTQGECLFLDAMFINKKNKALI